MFLATLTLKNHGICSGFCFSPRKNTVNNSNFAVFSCFSLFFELRWSAIHGYQILRVFFSDNQYFRMFLVSMADIIGSYERLPNDAVRAVAVAKRREYPRNIHWIWRYPIVRPSWAAHEQSCRSWRRSCSSTPAREGLAWRPQCPIRILQ